MDSNIEKFDQDEPLIINKIQEQPQSSPLKYQSQEMKVFLFEFLGMALFAYGIICSRGSDALLALFFLAAVCFAAPFSGAHINPAVTLAMLLCRRINFGMAIIYWLAQFSGAFVGAALCYLIVEVSGSPELKDLEWHWILSDFCGEILGTFTFITFILIQASPDTTFTPDAQPLTTYCLVALSLYISRGYTTHSGGCLNPGMAISLTAFEQLNNGVKDNKYIWIWVAGPFAGAFVASVFYEWIFKKLRR